LGANQAPGAVVLGGGATTQLNADLSVVSSIQFQGPLALGKDVTLTVALNGVTVAGALTANGHNLTVTGDALFANAATVNGLNNLNVSGKATLGLGSLTTSGSQSYGNVLLTSATSLTGTA